MKYDFQKAYHAPELCFTYLTHADVISTSTVLDGVVENSESGYGIVQAWEQGV